MAQKELNLLKSTGTTKLKYSILFYMLTTIPPAWRMKMSCLIFRYCTGVRTDLYEAALLEPLHGLQLCKVVQGHTIQLQQDSRNQDRVRYIYFTYVRLKHKTAKQMGHQVRRIFWSDLSEI
jgi:hypothetical protein